MSGIELNSNVRTKYFDICMINANYPMVKVDGMPQVRSEKPAHNSTSHYRSSLEYLSQGIAELEERKSTPVDKIKKRRGRRIAGGY